MFTTLKLHREIIRSVVLALCYQFLYDYSQYLTGDKY